MNNFITSVYIFTTITILDCAVLILKHLLYKIMQYYIGSILITPHVYS